MKHFVRVFLLILLIYEIYWSFLEAEVIRRWLLSQTAGLLLVVVVAAAELIEASSLCAADDDANSCGSRTDMLAASARRYRHHHHHHHHGWLQQQDRDRSPHHARLVVGVGPSCQSASGGGFGHGPRGPCFGAARMVTHPLRADDVFSTCCCRSILLPSGVIIDEFLAEGC